MGNIISRLLGNNFNNSGSRQAIADRSNERYQRSTADASPVHKPQQEAPLRPVSVHSTKESAPKDIVPPPKPPKPKLNLDKTTETRREPVIYTTTFETQVDAAPPHPLEEQLLIRQSQQFDEIEIDTNLYTPEVEDAVIKIQAGVRGYLTRKQIKSVKRETSVTSPECRNGDVAIVPPPKSFEDITYSTPTQTKSAPIHIQNIAFQQTVVNRNDKPTQVDSRREINVQQSGPQNEIKTVEQRVGELLFDDCSAKESETVVAIEVPKESAIIGPQKVNEKQIYETKENKVMETVVAQKKSLFSDKTEPIFKATVDQFVVKPQSPPIMSNASAPQVEEHKIEITSSNNEDYVTSDVTNASLPFEPQEVQPPSPQPIIQIESQNGSILDEEEAAIRIQAAFRGYQTRRTLSREASPLRSPSGNSGNATPNFELQNNSSNLFVNNSCQLQVNDEKESQSNVDMNDSSRLAQIEEQLLQQLISESKAENVTDKTINSADGVVKNGSVETNTAESQELRQNVEVRRENNTTIYEVKSDSKVIDDESANKDEVENIQSQTTVENQSLPQLSPEEQVIAELNQTLDSHTEFMPKTENIVPLKPVLTHICSTESEQSVTEVPKSEITTSQGIDDEVNQQQVQQISEPIVAVPQEYVNEESKNIETEAISPETTQIECSINLSVQHNNEEISVIQQEINIKTEQQMPIEEPHIIQNTQQEAAKPEVTSQEDQLIIRNNDSQQITIIEPQKSEETVAENATKDYQNKENIECKAEANEQTKLEARVQQESAAKTEESKENTQQTQTSDSYPQIVTDLPTDESKSCPTFVTSQSPQILSTITETTSGPSTPEEISSPDDDPECVGLSPNSPIPVRASSPNPFGKRRRRGRKGGRKN